MDIEMSKEEWVQNQRKAIARFMLKYPVIFKGRKFENNKFKEIWKEICRQTEDGKDSDFVLAMYKSDNDIIHYVFMALFLRLNKQPSEIKIFNVYELLQIYFNNHELYNSILEVQGKIIVVTLGYGEFFNRRYGDFIIHLMEIQKSRACKFWLFFKGEGFYKDYPDIRELMDINEADIYNFGSETDKIKEPSNSDVETINQFRGGYDYDCSL